MDFNINQPLFFMTDEVTEEEIEAYCKTLLDLFAKSPEGQAVLQGGEVAWADMFLEVVIYREQIDLRFLDTRWMRDIFYYTIPQSVIIDPNDAPEIIREVKAFWEFLKREFDLPNADACLKVLNQKNILKRFTEELNNSDKYSPTKRIVMEMQDSGVDISDQSQVAKFIEEYNAKIAESMKPPPITEKAKQQYDAVKKLIWEFCGKHLNDEYYDLSLKLLDQFLVDFPDRLEWGQAKSWAAAMVYTIGHVNFLADPNTEPYLSAADLREGFGVSQSTIGTKFGEISHYYDIMRFDPKWTTTSMMDRNPLIWMIPMDGYIVDIRNEPREVQEKVYEAGWIPYIPADRKS